MHEAVLTNMRRQLREFPEANLVDETRGVWVFGGREGRYERETELRKVAFLEILLQGFDAMLLDYGEDPVDDELAGDWVAIAEGYWRIPTAVDLEQLYPWLEYGNWVLSAPLPGRNLRPWRFESHRNPAAVIDAMVDAGVLFGLHAFHDNAPWFLFLHPDAKFG